KGVGPPADVFALGAVLYECLGGVPPFTGDTILDLFARVETGRFTKLERLRPDAPPWLVATIERALSFKPSDRFTDGEAFALALEAGEPERLPVGRIAGSFALVGLAVGLVALGAFAFSKRPRSALALAQEAEARLGAGDVERAAALTSEALVQ